LNIGHVCLPISTIEINRDVGAERIDLAQAFEVLQIWMSRAPRDSAMQGVDNLSFVPVGD
tara:strand:+ start:2356 stop:2535 length:180 start_codon:yes stop_codon:yes gene_type:complete